MMSFGVFELVLVLAGLVFYGFLFWLAWTLVMSVKGIRDEMTLMRQEVRRVLEQRGA